MESTESKAVDTLLSKGVTFEIDSRGLRKYIRKKHTYKLHQAYLGTLLILSKYYLKVGFDENKLTENPMVTAREIMAVDTKVMARIAAIGILNSKWKIRLFSRHLANFLLWRLTPKRLSELCLTIVMLNNTGDFINSIRLMSALRMTQPKQENLSLDNQGG